MKKVRGFHKGENESRNTVRHTIKSSTGRFRSKKSVQKVNDQRKKRLQKLAEVCYCFFKVNSIIFNIYEILLKI